MKQWIVYTVMLCFYEWTHFIFKLPCTPDDEVDYQLIHFYEETKVKFADLSEDMLWEYINSGEPM